MHYISMGINLLGVARTQELASCYVDRLGAYHHQVSCVLVPVPVVNGA